MEDQSSGNYSHSYGGGNIIQQKPSGNKRKAKKKTKPRRKSMKRIFG